MTPARKSEIQRLLTGPGHRLDHREWQALGRELWEQLALVEGARDEWMRLHDVERERVEELEPVVSAAPVLAQWAAEEIEAAQLQDWEDISPGLQAVLDAIDVVRPPKNSGSQPGAREPNETNAEDSASAPGAESKSADHNKPAPTVAQVDAGASATPEPASPLPWEAMQRADDYHDDGNWWSAGDWWIADENGCYVAAVGGASVDGQETAYIAHACNAYPGLVEERDRLAERVEKLADLEQRQRRRGDQWRDRAEKVESRCTEWEESNQLLRHEVARLGTRLDAQYAVARELRVDYAHLKADRDAAQARVGEAEAELTEADEAHRRVVRQKEEMQHERDGLAAEQQADLDGRLALRKKYGARGGETFGAFVERAFADLAKLREQPTAEAEGVPECVRPEVAQFALIMEEKLQANDYKGGWSDCDWQWLVDKIHEEKQELVGTCMQAERLSGHRAAEKRSEIVREAADVANMAMMVADVAGNLMAFAAHPRPIAHPKPAAVTVGDETDLCDHGTVAGERCVACGRQFAEPEPAAVPDGVPQQRLGGLTMAEAITALRDGIRDAFASATNAPVIVAARGGGDVEVLRRFAVDYADETQSGKALVGDLEQDRGKDDIVPLVLHAAGRSTVLDRGEVVEVLRFVEGLTKEPCLGSCDGSPRCVAEHPDDDYEWCYTCLARKALAPLRHLVEGEALGDD